MTNQYEDLHCYIIIGGELEFVHMNHFRDLSQVKSYGPYPTRDEAVAEWRRLSMSTVDNAHMKYMIMKAY